jgi:hypothetical protein
MKSIPWPLTEAQIAVVAAVWDNQLELPSIQEMGEWSQQLEEAKGGQALHVMDLFADGHLLNEMHDWAIKADYLGKTPPRWDHEQFWIRKIFHQAKLRFELGGCKAKTLADLDLVYDPDEEVV